MYKRYPEDPTYHRFERDAETYENRDILGRVL